MKRIISFFAIATLALTHAGCAAEEPVVGDFTNGGDPPGSMEGDEPKGDGRDKSNPLESSSGGSSSPSQQPQPGGNTTSNPPPGTPGTPSCNRNNSFLAPVPLAGLPADQHFATPRLSTDELTIFFTAHVNGVAKLHQAVRANINAPFGQPQALNTQSSNNNAKDNDPSISSDGLSLWFSSERNSGNGDDLFVSRRAAPSGAFGAPSPVTGINTSADEQHPYSRSANELWFSSSRTGTWAIYRAELSANGQWSSAIVNELQSSSGARQPMITQDGLTIIFSTERSGGRGKRDIWQAQRGLVTGPFGTPTPITAINSSASEFAGWMSPDGCRIYFSSDREEEDRHRIFVAARQ